MRSGKELDEVIQLIAEQSKSNDVALQDVPVEKDIQNTFAKDMSNSKAKGEKKLDPI